MDNYLISGGVSGAITDIYSEEADNHAQMYYREIRSYSTDVEKIVENTNGIFTYNEILCIKKYLFLDEHDLGDGDYRRFDPDFSIAQSWQRLAFDKDKIQPHDITLLKHELFELTLVDGGTPQDEAHEIVSKKYNYSKESEQYYMNLQNGGVNNG